MCVKESKSLSTLKIWQGISFYNCSIHLRHLMHYQELIPFTLCLQYTIKMSLAKSSNTS